MPEVGGTSKYTYVHSNGPQVDLVVRRERESVVRALQRAVFVEANHTMLGGVRVGSFTAK